MMGKMKNQESEAVQKTKISENGKINKCFKKISNRKKNRRKMEVSYSKQKKKN